MPKITFLEATSPAVPLVKIITKTDTGIETENYPNAYKYNSITHDVGTISDLARLLHIYQGTGHCLLKGMISRELKDEPRAGTTRTDQVTQWVCFDLDSAPFKTPKDFMEAMKLGEVAHVVQYSASHGLPHKTGLSCHIFAFLDKPMPAPQLKNWLIYLNLNTKLLRDGLRASDTAIALSYPLDVTTCQNDKLLFIGAPVFHGMKDPLKSRIEFVPGKKSVIPTTMIALHAPEALRKLCREILNEKRVAMQLPLLKAKTVIVGEHEVQNNPGELNMTGRKIARDFVYFNIGSGKNWSYFHPVDNYELIFNFKGEPCVRTKDVFPDYYKDCVRERNKSDASPTADGDMILAFRDCHTATYWHGTFNAATRKLELFPARSETQMDHFMLSHNKQPLPFIPLYQRIFDPSSEVIVNKDALPYPTVNLFHPSPYMKNAKKTSKPNLGGCPTISRIIEHAVGEGDIVEHFYNWLAVLFQLRKKPRTAWVLHGIQGTGKDMLVHDILRPLFGPQWVVSRNQTELNSDFTGWIEFALIAHIREIEIDSLENGAAVESKIKNYVTDQTVPIRKMRTDSYEAPNFTGTIFSSNKPQPVKIAVDDRRFNVGRFQMYKLEVTTHEVEELIPAELQAFADYLVSREADRAKAGIPLRTEERSAIQALSMTSTDHTAQYVLDGNLEGLWEFMPDEKTVNEVYGTTAVATYASAYAALMRRCLTDYLSKRESRLTREELGVIFQYCVGNVPTQPGKLTSYLGHHGIKLIRMRDGADRVSALKVEWSASEAFLKEVTADAPEPVSLKPVTVRRKA